MYTFCLFAVQTNNQNENHFSYNSLTLSLSSEALPLFCESVVNEKMAKKTAHTFFIIWKKYLDMATYCGSLMLLPPCYAGVAVHTGRSGSSRRRLAAHYGRILKQTTK